MIYPMQGDLVAFVTHTLHERRPSLGALSENEPRCLDFALGEQVEEPRSNVWVRSVVDGEGYVRQIPARLNRADPTAE